MTTLLEASRLALEALEADEQDMVADKDGHMVFRVDAAITALRQAIEQAQKQEQQHPMMDMPHDQKILHAYGYHKPQRQWVGLTDEEIFETHKQVDSMQYLTFGKAIEAKLKEKNT